MTANGNGKDAHDREVSLVTGFPAFTARRLVLKLLATSTDERVCLLVPPPRATFPPLKIACPPTSVFASIRITDAPASIA